MLENLSPEKLNAASGVWDGLFQETDLPGAVSAHLFSSAGKLDWLRKVFEDYGPENAPFVLSIIGNREYANVTAQIVFFASSAMRFIVSQYQAVLDDYYVQMKKLQESILSYTIGQDKEKLKNIAALVSEVMKDFENYPHSRRQLLALHMFAGFARELLGVEEIKNRAQIVVACKALVHINLSTAKGSGLFGGFWGALIRNSPDIAFTPVNMEAFAKVARNKLMNQGEHSTVPDAPNHSDYIKDGADITDENNSRIQSNLDALQKQCAYENAFVQSPAFRTIYLRAGADEYGVIKAQGSYLEDDDLTVVMADLSKKLVAKSGIYGVSFLERLITFAIPTAASLSVTYSATILSSNNIIPQYVVPAFSAYSVRFLSAGATYITGFFRKVFGAYSDTDIGFNKSVSSLLISRDIYPKLAENGDVIEITVSNELQASLYIIAKSIHDSVSWKEKADQEQAAMGRVMFSLLSGYKAEFKNDKLQKLAASIVQLMDAKDQPSSWLEKIPGFADYYRMERFKNGVRNVMMTEMVNSTSIF